MKTRRIGTNDDFKDVSGVTIDDWTLLKIQDVEFEHDTLSTELQTYDQIDEEKHWQDVRERAAIAAMQGLIPEQKGIWAICDEHLKSHSVAREAIDYANALIEELKKK